MNDNRPILDLEIAARDKKFATYWSIEIKLIYTIYVVQALCLIISLGSYFFAPKLLIFSIVYLCLAVGALSHFLLVCWQLLNGIVFAFLDKANKTMRYKYLFYVLSTLALIIPCGLLAEYCDNFMGDISWIVFSIINIVILPHFVFYYYLQTLRKSIA